MQWMEAAIGKTHTLLNRITEYAVIRVMGHLPDTRKRMAPPQRHKKRNAIAKFTRTQKILALMTVMVYATAEKTPATTHPLHIDTDLEIVGVDNRAS